MKDSIKPVEILYVTDSKADSFLLRAVFDELDVCPVKVTAVRSAQEAMSYLSFSDGSMPDLILLEVNLDGRSWSHLLQDIKKLPRAKEIPVIVFTYSDDESEEEKAIKLGASSFITKPIELEDYKAVITSFLNHLKREDS